MGKGLDDVKNIQQYKAIFDEWMQKKNSDELRHVQEQLNNTGNNFQPVIDEMLARIFPSNYLPVSVHPKTGIGSIRA